MLHLKFAERDEPNGRQSAIMRWARRGLTAMLGVLCAFAVYEVIEFARAYWSVLRG